MTWSELTERLRDLAAIDNCQASLEAAAEIERLRVENIQMRFALGYPMPADLERHVLPSNPFQCGVCDARRKAAMDAIIDADRELI
jgi:hypothetical protein